MHQIIVSKQLIDSWQEEQHSLMVQQRNWQCYGVSDDVANYKFYLKTLSGLAVCRELVTNNAQLKELNYNKLTRLRRRITEVSARVEAFRELLNEFYKPFEADNH